MLDSPGRYLASRWTSKLSVYLRRQLVNKHRDLDTVPPYLLTYATTVELSHIAVTW